MLGNPVHTMDVKVDQVTATNCYAEGVLCCGVAAIIDNTQEAPWPPTPTSKVTTLTWPATRFIIATSA